MKILSVIAAVLLSALFSSGQEVTVTPGKDSVGLSVSAQKPYELLAGQKKVPVLSIQCVLKSKKSVHLITFTAGEVLAENDAESAPKNKSFVLHMVVGGKSMATDWIPYNDPITYAYYGQTEPERVSFLQLLLNSPSATIEFTPFLTGALATSVFDLSKLHDEVNSHPECLAK